VPLQAETKCKYKGENKMITKDMIIGEVLDIDTGCAQYFFEIGMHCLGCPASRGESVEMACAVHGVDCDELLTKINSFLKNK
jgi:hybrid cluster-associated redox disulfide protein